MTDKYDYLIEKRYAEFKNVLQRCGCFLLSADADDIEYYIFEEFDIGVRTYMYDDMLELFLENGLIDEEIEKRCRLLRSAFVEIQPNYQELWNVQSVIKHPKWKYILELSDEIKDLLYF